jgi:glycosyltransferase involved in cell wall biosynthesis
MTTPKNNKVVVLGSLAESLINFRKDLLVELVSRGYQVVAAAPDMDPVTSAALQRLGVQSREVALSRTGMNPASDLRGFFRLISFLRRENPGALIAYTAKPVVYGLLASRFAGIAHTGAMITGLGFAFTEGPGLRRRIARFVAGALYRLAFRRATCVVFQNEDDKALFVSNGFVPVRLKPTIVNGSGVDLDAFKPTPLPERPVFLMVSRLLGAKGVREYAAAARNLREKCPEARTLLVGWIDKSPDAVSADDLKQWQIEGMEYLGKLQDVRSAIASANVVVLPSYREGTPRSVLEGMAMGRAIITTDVPGCRMTVEDGVNGYKVPARDADSLANAMIQLASNKALRETMGRQSRQRVSKLYESRSVARATADALGLQGTK